MIRSNHLRKILERCLAVCLAHAGNARSAASTAWVASAVLIFGTFASSTPLTGLVTGLAGVPVQAPSIKHWSRNNEGSFRRSRSEGAEAFEARAAAVGVMASLLQGSWRAFDIDPDFRPK